MVNFNPNLNISQNSLNQTFANNQTKSVANPNLPGVNESAGSETKETNFSDALKTIDNYISDVDAQQQSSDLSIKDLLSSSNADITSVVSAVAKADVSFKLLVGVRNKLIEAYKQTMNMPL
jgi:flagellar hook-basal body complex protein FliE